MNEIRLTQGNVTIVDDDDFEFINQYKWRSQTSKATIYAVREAKRKSILMHRLVLERKLGRKLTAKEVTDHKDHDGLNNKRDNLRACSQSENMMNARKRKSNTTGITGVHFNKSRKKYEAYINAYKCRYRLGRFKTIKEAATARKLAEQKYFN